jgi:hypothetical protein
MAVAQTVPSQVFATPFLLLRGVITWDEASTGTQDIDFDYSGSGQDLEGAAPFCVLTRTLTQPADVSMITYTVEAADAAAQEVTITAFSGDIAAAGAGGAPATLVGATTEVLLFFVPQAQQDGSSINQDVDD